jgi:hypothetical protein
MRGSPYRAWPAIPQESRLSRALHALILTTAAATAQETLPGFAGAITEPVLRSYLARAVTFMDGLTEGGDIADDIRMLRSCGARYLGRGIYLWGHETALAAKLKEAGGRIARIHAADPGMMVEACIFEIVSDEVDRLPVPAWAFSGLGLPPEERSFRYSDMIYADGKGQKWRGNGNAQVPDVSRPETRLWFYFLARTYIDLGCEAIHYGQVQLMDRNDRDHAHWRAVFDQARAYARDHARRHLLLCNAHVPGGGFVQDGRLMLDFHAFPLRIKEVVDHPREGVLEMGYSDGLYGRSKGGLTPSGWRCEHLPYLVEFDNYGASRSPGEARMGDPWVWGWDEITWFAQLERPARDAWLRYAWTWVRTHDPAGYLQMPVRRMTTRASDGRRTYRANHPSAAAPDGYDQEDAIRDIWHADDAKAGVSR